MKINEHQWNSMEFNGISNEIQSVVYLGGKSRK